MKASGTTIGKLAAVCALACCLTSNIHAQTAVVGSLNNGFAPVQSATPDSIVQLTADAQGLPQIAPADLPRTGTYWLVMPSGFPAPAPCPPVDPGVPVYQMASGQFLVDETGGQVAVNPRRFGMQAQSRSSAVTSALAAQANTVLDLITQVQTATANEQMQAMGLDVPSPDGGGSGTNGFYSDSFNFHPDYGTNLFIAQANLASGGLSGIVSNSFADIQYEIQYTTDLTQPWQSAGWFAYGSELTNWTPFSVPGISPTNLFLRIRSWQDDGSGLPIWWQEQYFGTTGVDPYGDPKGDGWNNLQKFQNGMNPNVFYTPPAPQGLSVAYHPANNTAAISWQPSPGSVTGYTVTRNNNGTITTFNFNSPNTTSFTDTTQDQTPDVNDVWGGPVSYNPTYQVQAQYTGGYSSALSASVKLLSSQNAITVDIAPNSQGSQNLVVSEIPPNTTALQVTRIGPWNQWNNPQADTTATSYNIPVASLNNGVYALSDAQTVPPDGSYYSWWVQTVNSNGVPSDATSGNGGTYPYNFFAASSAQTPFYDGRRQLKDNLIFLLREPTWSDWYQMGSFQVALLDSNGYATNLITAPTNYAYAGYYQSGTGTYGGDSPDVFRPFEDNYFYRNFVFSLADIDGNGNLTTGLGQSVGSCIFYEDKGWYDGLTLHNPAYQFQPPTGETNISSLLSPSDTQWLYSYPFSAPYEAPVTVTNDTIYYDDLAGSGIIYTYNDDTGDSIYMMASGARNYFGLPLQSVWLEYHSYVNNDMESYIFYPGDEFIPPMDQAPNVCPDAAQPQFQTVEYDFWNPNTVWKIGGPVLPTLPGDPDFSPTNASSFLIAGLADPYFQVAGYAKLAVVNGYPGVYGYLGQYFDAAYTEDANGVATTNSAGFLTPYGNFFATEVGRAALVTMPDPDTGVRGTNTVYVVGLKLDVNHDGVMDMSYTGPDNTSQASPYVFWANNNFDRFTRDTDDGAYYDDDVPINNPDAKSPYTGQPTPDCNYLDGAGHRVIPCARDLQDFTRLWICGVTSNLLAALPAGSTVTLSWAGKWDGYEYTYSNYPTIDLFTAADPDGGIGYLTNSTIADEQVDSLYCPYIGRLAPGGSIQLNASTFANHWAGNHFIFCGVSNGTGGLNLTITDGSGNVLGQSTAYLQIVDIKDMYERWTVGDNPNQAPLTTATNAYNDLPSPAPFHYTVPQDTNTPYVLYVHGWNMEAWEKDRFAEAAFKRLYWQGYQGRFGSFRWPTYNGFTGSFWQTLTDARNFDNSEFIAWQSSAGLLNKLNDLNAEYPGHVYMLAHSMGNVVAGEALRLAGNNQVVNTYVASQAALPAHDYDATVTTPYLLPFSYWYPSGPLWAAGTVNYGPDTPNIYGNWLVTNAAAVGRRISFYNQNDFALAMPRWGFDQITKPDYIPPNNFYYYAGGVNDSAPWNKFMDSPIIGGNGVLVDIVTNLNNHYKIMAYAAESRSTALGATPTVVTLTKNVDMTSPDNNIWPIDTSGHNYADHFWHSAEFRGDCWQEWNYWQTLLRSSTLGFNIQN
jgi:hypothetical protein